MDTVSVRIAPPAVSGSVTTSPSQGTVLQARRDAPLTVTRHLPHRPLPPQAAGRENPARRSADSSVSPSCTAAVQVLPPHCT